MLGIILKDTSWNKEDKDPRGADISSQERHITDDMHKYSILERDKYNGKVK